METRKPLDLSTGLKWYLRAMRGSQNLLFCTSELGHCGQLVSNFRIEALNASCLCYVDLFLCFVCDSPLRLDCTASTEATSATTTLLSALIPLSALSLSIFLTNLISCFLRHHCPRCSRNPLSCFLYYWRSWKRLLVLKLLTPGFPSKRWSALLSSKKWMQSRPLRLRYC